MKEGERIWDEGGQSSHRDDFSNRPQLTALLTEVDLGTVKHLWVYNTDRLSRNESTWSVIRLKLIKNNVTLYTASGLFSLSNPLDKLLLGVLSEISSYDNHLRLERTRLGKIKRIQQGYWMGGPPPYGYRVEKKVLVPNPEETPWVKYVFENYAGGKTIREIRQYLMENGVKTRRGNSVWSFGSIEALLSNTHYSGYFVVRDKQANKPIRVSCTAILDSGLVDSVTKQRQLRSARRAKESRQSHFYLLRDFLVCGHCGSRFSGRYYPKQKRSVYYCPRKERNHVKQGTSGLIRCTNSRYLKIEKTDEIVWETVIHTLATSGRYAKEIRPDLPNPDDLAEQASKLQKQIKSLDREIQQATDSLVRVESDALLTRRTADERQRIIHKIEEHRRDLETKKQGLQRELHSAGEQKRWSVWFREFGNRMLNVFNLPKGEPRHRFLKGVLDTITVETLDLRRHRLSIRFTVPCVSESKTGGDNVFHLEIEPDDDFDPVSKGKKKPD